MDGNHLDGIIIVMQSTSESPRAATTDCSNRATPGSPTGTVSTNNKNWPRAKAYPLPGQAVLVAEQLPRYFVILMGAYRIRCCVEWRGPQHTVVNIGGRIMTLGNMQRVVCFAGAER